ncbi:RIFT barrel domain-containing protein [Limnoglobus roseus]|uniref:PcRGLX/YetA-like N-terminal RIFT barrel domain-containing protein n=1 Tax=Limnoglobus roseus TaxID=2598579 RepID=A0A5C1AAF9_9BACT|nr:hypothetical protein [Limnoglobus roseus]QEL16201.1 hypothetical protein PX52LOC_03141 [Limnoglobus roseus]
MPSLSCPMRFFTQEPGPRRGEPVTVGLPWPRGAVTDERQFQLVGSAGTGTLQTKVLDRWPDGSVRWCLFDFLATWDGRAGESGYRVEVGEPIPREASPLVVHRENNSLRIETGTRSFRITVGSGFPFDAVDSLVADNERYWNAKFVTRRVEVLEEGPVRACVRVHADALHIDGSNYADVLAFADVTFHVKSSTVSVRLTVRNTCAADHPGGNWDLGTVGCERHRDLTVAVPFDIDALRNRETIEDAYGPTDLGPALSTTPAEIRVSSERGQPMVARSTTFALYQDSSGGANWQSSNHLTASRQIATEFRGYELRDGDHATKGDRATPIVTVAQGGQLLGATMPDFWENFPKAVEADPRGLLLRLFPRQSKHGHELQGGEQKTHTFSLAFGVSTITDEPLVWCRSPIVCHAAPKWYAASGAIPYLTPKADDPHAKYLTLVDLALDGSDTFLHKREKIDEYGWRNFGEIYGDHEAVNHKGETPMISHYNNQYDCVAAFLIQFFRSGDLRWLSQGLECADHTCDIDLYHTDDDKAAYNRGLFWHTYHYADADTGTHRSYPKSLTRGPVESLTQKMDKLGETAAQLKKSYAIGGGPSASHNYNAGLMLAYFLTGNSLYRDSALDLANFVINMEDPARTPFRFLSREYTGLATESGGGGYHGPGRAAANSILALLVGHQLTGDAKYLEKAEQLIRRVVHPKQNLDRLDLLNAELRWFYTMTLQALGHYLDYKVELGQLDRMYAYARLTLLHYARWMAQHERPILDTPERLQYPTETWAAQDMRKVEVFQFAAKHAVGEERAKFLERAEWFFNYVPDKLSTFETKSLTRPVILMMKYGWSRNWWRQNPTAAAPEPAVAVTSDDFGEWRMFVPQKAKAIKRAKRIVVLGGLLGVIAIAGLAVWLLS